MSVKVDFHVTGVKEVDRQLKRVASIAQRKVQRKSLNKIGRRMVKEVRGALGVKSTDTRTLWRSIGHKVKFYNVSATAMVLIGPRSQFRRNKKTGERTRLKAKFAQSKAMPTKYAHLVEFGTVHSRPRAFLKPALDRAAQYVTPMYAGVLRSEINKELAKNPGSAA